MVSDGRLQMGWPWVKNAFWVKILISLLLSGTVLWKIRVEEFTFCSFVDQILSHLFATFVQNGRGWFNQLRIGREEASGDAVLPYCSCFCDVPSSQMLVTFSWNLGVKEEAFFP